MNTTDNTQAPSSRRHLLTGAVAVGALAAGAGWAWWRHSLGDVGDAAQQALWQQEFTGLPGQAPVRMQSYKGQPLLLNIWATWCPPCREEMPTLDALQARLGGSDFHVLPLSIDRAGLEPVRRFYRETGIRNLDLYIAEDTRAMLALAVVGLPTTILIDRIGRERGRLAGPAEWNSPEAVAQISALIDERKQ